MSGQVLGRYSGKINTFLYTRKKSVVKTQNVEKEKEVMKLMFLSYSVLMTQSYAGIVQFCAVRRAHPNHEGHSDSREH